MQVSGTGVKLAGAYLAIVVVFVILGGLCALRPQSPGEIGCEVITYIPIMPLFVIVGTIAHSLGLTGTFSPGLFFAYTTATLAFFYGVGFIWDRNH